METYEVSVLKLSNVSFRGKCARMENTLKLPSPTKLARLGHFPPASQVGRLAGPVFYVYVFSLVFCTTLHTWEAYEESNNFASHCLQKLTSRRKSTSEIEELKNEYDGVGS
jgi:hypothetical protein